MKTLDQMILEIRTALVSNVTVDWGTLKQEVTNPSERIKYNFDHTRIRYIHLTQWVAVVRFYTKRYSKWFRNKYRCYEAVASSECRSDEPEIRSVSFCTTGKTGAYLCTKPVFPEYDGKNRSRNLEHDELYRKMLLLHYEIDLLKDRIAEHRQKMIETQLPSAFSAYEEALFQD